MELNSDPLSSRNSHDADDRPRPLSASRISSLGPESFRQSNLPVTWQVPLEAPCKGGDKPGFGAASQTRLLGLPQMAALSMFFSTCAPVPRCHPKLFMSEHAQVWWLPAQDRDRVPGGVYFPGCSSTLAVVATSGCLTAPSQPRSHVLVDIKMLDLPSATYSGCQECNVPGYSQSRWGESLHPDSKIAELEVEGLTRIAGPESEDQEYGCGQVSEDVQPGTHADKGHLPQVGRAAR